MRGGAQGATSARPEICTVRGKHEIYGDERGRLTNNKSKGSKAQTQATLDTHAAGRFALRLACAGPLCLPEIVVESLCVRQKLTNNKSNEGSDAGFHAS